MSALAGCLFSLGLGFFVGGFFGALVMAVMVAAGRGER
jgi:hypothetical protein